MQVGPGSAGAVPGPVCYGRGGEEPMVTDANVILGRIPPSVQLGGTMELNRNAAHEVIEPIAEDCGTSVEEAAQTVLNVVNENMHGALQVVSVERGYDPREFGLVALGGAGRFRGGHGIMKVYTFEEDGAITFQDDRAHTYPWGVDGGKHGDTSQIRLIRTDGTEEELPSKVENVPVRANDKLVFHTAGGGGLGDPLRAGPGGRRRGGPARSRQRVGSRLRVRRRAGGRRHRQRGGDRGPPRGTPGRPQGRRVVRLRSASQLWGIGRTDSRRTLGVRRALRLSHRYTH